MSNSEEISDRGSRTPYALSPAPPEAASRWYAIYTRPRAEKRTAERLVEAGIEVYLPLVKTMRVWSDRRKMVEKPLINSYLFVKVHESSLREVLGVEGACRYIAFEGKAAAIPEEQIMNLRLLVDSEADVEVTGERISKGDPVRVTHGSLRGLTGEIIKIGNRNRVVVRIESIEMNLVVTIKKAFLEKRR